MTTLCQLPDLYSLLAGSENISLFHTESQRLYWCFMYNAKYFLGRIYIPNPDGLIVACCSEIAVVNAKTSCPYWISMRKACPCFTAGYHPHSGSTIITCSYKIIS